MKREPSVVTSNRVGRVEQPVPPKSRRVDPSAFHRAIRPVVVIRSK